MFLQSWIAKLVEKLLPIAILILLSGYVFHLKSENRALEAKLNSAKTAQDDLINLCKGFNEIDQRVKKALSLKNPSSLEGFNEVLNTLYD